MNLTIELPDNIGTALQAQAQAQGLSPARYVSRVLETALAQDAAAGSDSPLLTGYGMWARYGPAPSAEELEENRREIFRNFAQDS